VKTLLSTNQPKLQKLAMALLKYEVRVPSTPFLPPHSLPPPPPNIHIHIHVFFPVSPVIVPDSMALTAPCLQHVTTLRKHVGGVYVA
jgi:hypothetical protein